MKRKLPIFKITIDEKFSEGEDLGVSMIANTKAPAIMVKGMAFQADDVKVMSFSDDLKYRIAGPILIPMQIYRCDEDDEYYVEFTKEEIELIHSKFYSKNNKEQVFNLEHNSDDVVPAYILESILVDSDNKVKLIKDEYNIDVPVGTSFIVQQFTDKEYYKKMVEEDRVGFSIEGFLGMKLSEIIDKHKKNNKIEMSKNTLVPGEEYILGDKLFIFGEDGTLIEKKKEEEVELEVIEDEKEEVVEEVKEELADEVAVEEKVEEVKEEPVVSYSKEELDAKFEELYKIIADLKVGEEKVEDVKEEPAMFTIHDRFAAFSRFASENK